jgi:mannose-6-phosphate isomerase-like protein (cupin superfamily)
MFIRDLQSCEEFIAGDHTVLRELIHPAKDNLELRYSLAFAVLGRGKTSFPHQLKTSEVYFILDGEGIMHIGEETARVIPGFAIYIPPNTRQFIQNTGRTDLKFICIVDPAWRPEDEFIFPEHYRTDLEMD